MIHVEVNRIQGDFGFEGTDASGHKVRMDTGTEGGGTDFGIRPMQMLLMGLGGCSGIDIVSILKKQRQTIDDFNMKIDAEREEGAIPSLWKEVNIIFELKGSIDPEKARKACELSVEKYCSVADTLRKSGTSIKWTVRVFNGEEAVSN